MVPLACFSVTVDSNDWARERAKVTIPTSAVSNHRNSSTHKHLSLGEGRTRSAGFVCAYASLLNRAISFHIVIFKATLLWYCAPRAWRTSGSVYVVIIIRVFPFRLVVIIFAALCVAYIRLRVTTDMFCGDVNIICFRSARKTGSNKVRWVDGVLFSPEPPTRQYTISTHEFSLQHIYLDKWIKMVNFKLGNEMWKVDWSTWHENGTKKKNLSPRQEFYHTHDDFDNADPSSVQDACHI